jgi:hypothetical protein
MPSPPFAPPPPDDALAQTRARAQRLSGAFAEVFGRPRGRTAAQKLVLEHLAKCASEDGNAFRFANDFDGWKTALVAAHLDGAQSMMRIILRQIMLASESAKPKKGAPQTIR